MSQQHFHKAFVTRQACTFKMTVRGTAHIYYEYTVTVLSQQDAQKQRCQLIQTNHSTKKERLVRIGFKQTGAEIINRGAMEEAMRLVEKGRNEMKRC